MAPLRSDIFVATKTHDTIFDIAPMHS